MATDGPVILQKEKNLPCNYANSTLTTGINRKSQGRDVLKNEMPYPRS